MCCTEKTISTVSAGAVASEGKVPHTYIHGMGRRKKLTVCVCAGVSINFIVKKDVEYMRDIETFYNTQISEMPSNVADLI